MTGLITPNPAKHQQVLQLHAAFKALMEEIFLITIALQKERETQLSSSG
jgi:hypothetical protein